MVVRRGELWWADLGLPRGSAPALRRPILVVSADVTTALHLAALPGNISIPADAAGLPRDSALNVTQLATINHDALEQHISELPDWLLAQVDTGLERALALRAR